MIAGLANAVERKVELCPSGATEPLRSPDSTLEVYLRRN